MSFLSSIGHGLVGAATGFLTGGPGGALAGGLAGLGLGGNGGAGGVPAGAMMGGSQAYGDYRASKYGQEASNRAAQFDIDRYKQLQGQMAPWLTAGGGAEGSLANMLGIGKNTGQGGYGSLLQPYQFGEKAPGQFSFTENDFHKFSPAYNFEKNQLRQGVLNGASSGQGGLSGAAQMGLMDAQQGFADKAWNTAYDQAANTYGTNLNRYMDLNQMGFNQYNTQQNNIYSRLAGLAAGGLQGAGELGNWGTTLGTDTAQGISNAGAAQAYGAHSMGNNIGMGMAAGGGSYLDALAGKIGNGISDWWHNTSWGGGGGGDGTVDNNPWAISSLPQA